jgi:hypothetical protein
MPKSSNDSSAPATTRPNRPALHANRSMIRLNRHAIHAQRPTFHAHFRAPHIRRRALHIRKTDLRPNRGSVSLRKEPGGALVDAARDNQIISGVPANPPALVDTRVISTSITGVSAVKRFNGVKWTVVEGITSGEQYSFVRTGYF